MVNYLFSFFIIIGIIYSLITNRIHIINDVLLTTGSNALELIFNILPILMLWLGLMKIAEKSGLFIKLSKYITPILKFLFPEIPKNHEAFTLIASNIIMNIFGLGNAATPFGLKAMKSLQELNKNPDEASRSMITFLIINTASVTIIPTTVITLRMTNHSVNPASIIPLTIITSLIACILGLILDRLFYFLTRRKYEYR